MIFWYGSLVLFLEKVWIPFCLDLYGTWYKFVRILGFIWNMYGVIGFVPWSRVLPL